MKTMKLVCCCLLSLSLSCLSTCGGTNSFGLGGGRGVTSEFMGGVEESPEMKLCVYQVDAGTTVSVEELAEEVNAACFSDNLACGFEASGTNLKLWETCPYVVFLAIRSDDYDEASADIQGWTSGASRDMTTVRVFESYTFTD